MSFWKPKPLHLGPFNYQGNTPHARTAAISTEVNELLRGVRYGPAPLQEDFDKTVEDIGNYFDDVVEASEDDKSLTFLQGLRVDAHETLAITPRGVFHDVIVPLKQTIEAAKAAGLDVSDTAEPLERRAIEFYETTKDDFE